MTDRENAWQGGTFIPASLEFLNINYDVQKNCKSNIIRNQLYKPYDSFSKKEKYSETGISSSLQSVMYSEIQLNMDESQMKLKSLRSQSSVNKKESENTDASYVKEANSISKSGHTLRNNLIWNDCVSCTNDSITCTCNYLELPSCGSKTGQLHDSSDMSVDKLLCFKKGTPKLSMGGSGHGFSSGNFTGRMPSKSLLGHFENCTASNIMEENFSRSKKERSTLLIRRFCKNDKEIKKSVYTGTRAIVRTLPSGHIGAVAWNCVAQWKIHTELRNTGIISEQLKIPQVSINQALYYYLLQSIWHEVSCLFKIQFWNMVAGRCRI